MNLQEALIQAGLRNEADPRMECPKCGWTTSELDNSLKCPVCTTPLDRRSKNGKEYQHCD